MSSSEEDRRGPTALSAEEVERFVEHGCLLVREAFSPGVAARLVRETFVDRTPTPELSHRRTEGHDRIDLSAIELSDASTWGRTRLDVETRRSVPIEAFAPRLWSAIRQLVGEDRAITRRTMGEQWVLNGRFAPPPAPALEPSYYGMFEWHIDAPCPRTTLDERFDALVLLILWSDVDPGGGGTLYSGTSLDHVVRLLEAHPEGVDTTGYDWGTPLVRSHGGVHELTGRAGDVLITHPFVLHASQHNYSERVRILENPTITVAEPLRYDTDHPRPSPVERAVIRRLSRPRPRPADGAREMAAYLVERHPDYFLPGRAAWSAGIDADERRRVYAMDGRLTRAWASRLAGRIASRHLEPLQRVEAAIAELRRLVVNQRALSGHVRESVVDDDFGLTAWSRLLRGFVSCEGQNHLLALVLAELFDGVRLFDLMDRARDRSPHTLLRIDTAEGWFFADAWASHPIFHLRSAFGTPHPGTPEYDELDGAEEAVRRGALFPRRFYADGSLPDPWLRLELPDADRLAVVPARSAAPSDAPSAWQSYLTVRVEHVLGGHVGASAAYASLLRRHAIGGMTRKVIDALAERAGASPRSGP